MSDRSFLCALILCALSGCRGDSQTDRSSDVFADRVMTHDQVLRLEACDAWVEELKSCKAEASRADAAQAEASPDIAFQAEAPEFEPKAGGTYVLGQGNQTVVMNPKPVADALRRFAKGSVCRFDAEGKVTIVGKRVYKMDGDGEEETEYLVRYEREPEPEALHPGALEYPDAGPYECPDGTVFYLDDLSILEEEEPDAAFEAAKKLLDSEKP